MMEYKFIQIIFSILNKEHIQYYIAIGCILIAVFIIFFLLYTIISAYIRTRKNGKPISWIRLFDDIHWTLYDWNLHDEEYVMSLPRLVYFMSSVLILYVVVYDKSDMLTPLLGFNLSAASAYTAKKYIDSKKDMHDLDLEHVQSVEMFGQENVYHNAHNNENDVCSKPIHLQ